MRDDLISIITPVYNSERFISDTIDSILNQSYNNWEMIIVDDCSKDKSENIIRRYVNSDSRIKYIKLTKNSGAAVARNTAIEKSKGRYIAFLDSDDLWKETKLEKQLSFMKENDIGFSFTSYELINEDGSKVNKTIKAPLKIDYNTLLKNTIIGCLTVMIDREKIGEFNMPLIRARQDLATWLSILRKGNTAYGIQESLSEYRIVEGSISSNKFKIMKKNWYVYRKIEKLSLFKSIYVFVFYGINAVKKRF